MDMKHDQGADYTEPEVVDYGKLEDLTAGGGAAFIDTPMGTPAASITASSTP
jgi:hypothetical protein